jgi:solute carrier family 15 oligopeptide transporter 1
VFTEKPCLGQKTCFPLAFGIPTVIMVVAIAFFILGSRWYRKPPPTTNIFKEIFLIIKVCLIFLDYLFK